LVYLLCSQLLLWWPPCPPLYSLIHLIIFCISYFPFCFFGNKKWPMSRIILLNNYLCNHKEKPNQLLFIRNQTNGSYTCGVGDTEISSVAAFVLEERMKRNICNQLFWISTIAWDIRTKPLIQHSNPIQKPHLDLTPNNSVSV